MKLNKILTAVALLGASAAASAWYGPYNNNGFGNGWGDGYGDASFGFSMSGSARGNGYGYNNIGEGFYYNPPRRFQMSLTVDM